MAKVLKDYSFSPRVRVSKYPWDDWLDGRVWQLAAKDWHGSSVETIITQARNQSKTRGKKVRIRVSKDRESLVLQAYKAR